jgi:mannose-6-phosphate isomerase-like protein (cupin superfamily)
MAITRGRLRHPDAAPGSGEHVHRLARLENVVVDQILSGRLDGPLDYCQDTDEWVVVLHGGATLEVEDDRVHLGAGDWLLLPARTPHRLVEVHPGTSWLTVTAELRGPAASPGPAAT